MEEHSLNVILRKYMKIKIFEYLTFESYKERFKLNKLYHKSSFIRNI